MVYCLTGRCYCRFSGFIALRVDYSRREDEVLQYFSKQEGMPDAFAKLEEVTP